MAVLAEGGRRNLPDTGSTSIPPAVNCVSTPNGAIGSFSSPAVFVTLRQANTVSTTSFQLAVIAVKYQVTIMLLDDRYI